MVLTYGKAVQILFTKKIYCKISRKTKEYITKQILEPKRA